MVTSHERIKNTTTWLTLTWLFWDNGPECFFDKRISKWETQFFGFHRKHSLPIQNLQSAQERSKEGHYFHFLIYQWSEHELFPHKKLMRRRRRRRSQSQRENVERITYNRGTFTKDCLECKVWNRQPWWAAHDLPQMFAHLRQPNWIWCSSIDNSCHVIDYKPQG